MGKQLPLQLKNGLTKKATDHARAVLNCHWSVLEKQAAPRLQSPRHRDTTRAGYCYCRRACQLPAPPSLR